MTSGLELRGVSKSYGSVQAVKPLNLSIGEGEFFSLLGPSGCGKTSLLRLLGGFEQLDSGEIWLSGTRIDTLPANRRQFNTVFQRYALFPHLTVWENVAFGLQMKKVPSAEIRSRVTDALSLVQMESYADRRTTTLSGGQQQRIALARALVNRPRVLLLDEPLSALDLKLRQQMQVELRSLQRRLGHSFIFVTHDQEEALSLSDRMAVMNQGHVEQVGTPQEVYEFPQTAFVAGFIGTMNTFQAEVREVTPTSVIVTAPIAGSRRSLTIGTRDGIKPAGDVALTAGQSVQLMVRPEKLKCLKSAPGADQNAMEGVLKEILYHGPMTHFVVSVREERILVTQPNSMATAKKNLTVGEKVYIAWAPQDCLILGANGAAFTAPRAAATAVVSVDSTGSSSASSASAPAAIQPELFKA